MERFLRKFEFSNSRSQALRVFDAVAEQWTCSHLKRDCLIGGVCARQNWKDMIETTYESGRAEQAHRLGAIAEVSTSDRLTLWLQCLQSFERPYDEDIRGEIIKLGTEMLDDYRNSEMARQAGDLPNGPRLDRERMDDSLSALPYVYVPVNQGKIVTPQRIARFRHVGIVYYDPDDADEWLPPDAYHLRKVRNDLMEDIRAQLPVCYDSGFQGPIHRLVFLSVHMLPHMQSATFRRCINLYLTTAVRLEAQFSTSTEARLTMQTFGMVPPGESPMHRMMLSEIYINGEHTNWVRLRAKTRGLGSWESWLMPMTLVRKAIIDGAGSQRVFDFIRSDYPCQLCYLQSKDDAEFYIVDTRTADLMGLPAVRLVRAVSHAHKDFDVARERLSGNDHLGRIGSHYYVYAVHSGMEALITTAITIHKWIRGNGIFCDESWIEGVAMLFRVLVRWELNKKQLSCLYRLFCFVCFGYEPRHDGYIPDWYDLGKFLDVIFQGVELNMEELDVAHARMFKLGRLVITMSLNARTMAPDFDTGTEHADVLAQLCTQMREMWNNTLA
nr:Non-structural protein [Tibet orbivirus]